MRNAMGVARSALIALVISLSIVGGAAAGPARTGAIRIDNFAQVNDHYFRGSQPVGHDYADLAALGVKTVINLIGDASDLDPQEAAMVARQGMRYVNIPMSTRVPPTALQLDQFLALVNDAASQPVYVHCVGGSHRTGVMTAVYRITHDGLSGAQAFQEMKQFKYGPDFLHPEFKRFVQDFDAKRTAAVVIAGTHQ
jgi:protein tyrosine/serine phosphatase